MKVDSLRKLIKEEVRAAIREELSDILTEAVKIASKPEKEYKHDYKPVLEKDLKRTWSKGPLNPAVGLNSMLEQTAAEMTKEDFSNVINANSSNVRQPALASSVASSMAMNSGAQPGLDISQLDFVKKAKSVLDLAEQKDRSRGL